jgi:hypothetical protein
LVDREAIRSASPLLVQTWVRYQKAHEEIDKAFNGVLFDPNLRPEDEKKKTE